MACGGCAERADAIRKAMLALADGRTDDAKAEMQRFKQSASDDLARLRAAARQRLHLTPKK